jgi:hypothetical protein
MTTRIVALLSVLASFASVSAENKLQFNRDIRPILSDNCFLCHGPDKDHRKAGLRLDERESALKTKAIVPGDPKASELVARIRAKDKEELMPPVASHKKLTEEQKKLLERWIAEGAEYQGHWAYVKAVRPEVPAGHDAIDYLVGKRLARLGLKPSPQADPRTLVRRLAFDLVGLPPTPEVVDAFVKDTSSEAYDRLVETMLESPHYGERMAIGWLDVVRFADTIGYHSDNPRNIYPYRDYVIRAFQQNKPFDRFTIEQLAGDLLPDATLETRVASAFNRLLLTTEEGGAQAKDYEARMLGDRVRAVGAVWLGQTLGCCQCHDHKFDPSTMRDFYSMGAFFADIQEPIIGKREPGIVVAPPELEKELERLKQVEAELKKQYDAAMAAAGKNPPAEIADLLKLAPEKLSAKQKAKLDDYRKKNTPAELKDLQAKLAKATAAVADYDKSLPRCIVSVSMKTPRVVRILPRGNWLDSSGEIVKPALPAYLAKPSDRPLNRLDLAQWLVSPDHPLTARVFMNRLWKQFFGMPLSKVPDDLGSQGEWPANPELLDWLACEFQSSGWDIKHMVRLIVRSETYKQSSVASKELLARDPENRELARQSRFRLDAELVRDNALAISGLLNPKIGGPSVKPYQPEGYWENLNFPPRKYDADKSADQYRRGLYTWWQRTFPHPSMIAFDAPTREECTADRTRSNIPQQALVLLNDPSYVEAARAFAARILKEGGSDADTRITWAWRQALQRTPSAAERDLVRDLVAKHHKEFAADPKSAEALLKVGYAPIPPDLPPADLAAWTSVARVLLNLHETITRN